MSQSARHQLLLAVLSSLIFFVNLGAVRLWDIDEAIFSQAAAEMYQRGDYVVPYFNDQLFPDKPGLMYWTMISAYKMFGVNEFAARFWSAVFGMGSVLLTYQLGRRLFSASVGFWAGLALATNLNFGIIARAATPDSLLTFFSTLALLIFVCGALRRGSSVISDDGSPVPDLAEPSWGTYALTYAAMGAGVLVKGPVGVVLPTAVIGLFLLTTRGPNTLAQLPADPPRGGRWAWLRRLLDAMVRTFAPAHFVRTVWRMRPLTAVAAVLLVAGPWYVWVGLRTDWQWPAQFFGVHNFGRFLSAMDNHGGPIFYYLLVIPALFFPWSIVLGASLRELILSATRASRYRAGAILVACWLIVELGFFSLASTKLPNYIIPCYPALALMTALFVDRWFSKPASVPRAWLWVTFGILAVAGLGIVVGMPVAARVLAEPNWALGLAGLVPLVGALVGLWFVGRWQLSRAAIALGVTAAALSLFLSGVTVLEADRFHNTQQFVDAIAEQSAGPAQVASFRYFRPSMVFYGHRPISKLAVAEDVPEFFRTHPQDAFLYTLDEQMPKLSKLLPADVTVLETHRPLFKRGKILLLGRAADTPRWPAAQAAGEERGERVGHSPSGGDAPRR
jgi:4-amino-4-deoxy-L-arabinose transferase-like glycosyltransferase